MKLRQWSKSSRELSNDWTGTSLSMSPFGYHRGNSKPVTYRGHTGSEPKLGLRSTFAFLAIYNTTLLRMQPSDPTTGTALRNTLGIQRYGIRTRRSPASPGNSRHIKVWKSELYPLLSLYISGNFSVEDWCSHDRWPLWSQRPTCLELASRMLLRRRCSSLSPNQRSSPEADFSITSFTKAPDD